MDPERHRKQQEDEDLAHADDAIIGTALRWSLIVVVLLVVVGFATVRLMRRPTERETALPKTVGQIENLDQSEETMPSVQFVDVTEEAGIEFDHVNGATGQKLLPETMGSGAAFFDYDGDGDQDLLLVNGTHWPSSDPGGRPPSQALYRNDGTGQFEDVAAEVGLDVTLYGTGVATGDYDNDGDADLFLAALGHNRLFENAGGRFVDVTDRAGIAGEADAWSTSAGFVDHDNDGDLDLFVCNYVKWSERIDLELSFTLNGVDRAYGPPTNYEGTFSYLYRNDGNGSFTDVSEEAGIRVLNPLSGGPMGKALAHTFIDVDLDGWIDILVANDTVQNFLFRNRRDGTFVEQGSSSGLGFDSTGNATGAMGIDAGHHRGDAEIAVAVANFANEMSSLYVSRGRERALFTDEAAGEGIGSPSRLFLSFGLFFFDYDLDGRLDLLQANGHLESEIQEVQASQTYRQPAQLFWNAGSDARSCFAEVPPEVVGDLSRPIVGRGATYADIDADGDPDVLLTQAGEPPVLLRNEQRLGHHWLRVKLEGVRSNRDAVGSWVELQAGNTVHRRQVMPTRSYLSQVELPVTFGLGGVDEVERLEVQWPDGSRQVVPSPPVDRTVKVVESEVRERE